MTVLELINMLNGAHPLDKVVLTDFRTNSRHEIVNVEPKADMDDNIGCGIVSIDFGDVNSEC